MTDIELTWLGTSGEEDEDQPDLLAEYYREVASGPMTSYRRIIQGGNKQGQNYYAHVLDGIAVLHKLRAARIVEMSDIEERLLLAAYTVHDMNKIPPYGGRDVKLSFTNIATCENIGTELQRIDFGRYFYEWEEYLEDIKLLIHLHQHDAAPVFDLDQGKHSYKLLHERLLEFGELLYAVDNLDLSHTLAESNHKESFIVVINRISGRRWRWIKHRLGENRGLLSNIIHNEVVAYLRERHTHSDHSTIVDLLYYPDGVAYLMPEREQFTWSTTDTATVAQCIAQIVADKKVSNLDRFIKSKPIGIQVADAAVESGANYTDIMYVIRRIIDGKRYPEKSHNERNEKLRANLARIASNSPTANLADALLDSQLPIVPLDQALLRRGELASAYRNLLQNHLESQLKQAHKRDPWTHIYSLLNLPDENYALYNQISDYQRGYFIARDCEDEIDSLFDRFLADIVDLTGEQVAAPVENEAFSDYLASNLEISSGDTRDFMAHLQRYVKDNHKQCCNCSSPLLSVELMESDVPQNIGVQAFSNRLKGGGREPKRNVCPTCRVQFILEKLVRVAFKKNSEQHTCFYLHLYPYAFFTAQHLNAMYITLKNVCHEDNRCFFLNTDNYFQQWGKQLERSLASQVEQQASQNKRELRGEFVGYSTKINGVSVPSFSDAVGNIPILPLNAPGQNYGQQFIFALTHAIMIADFFGCRVVLSRTPIPLLTNEYMTDHTLAFFADGVPRNVRWLLPTDEYRSIETYRDKNETKDDAKYFKRHNQWSIEQPDEYDQAAYENISKRLHVMYQLPHELRLGGETRDELVLEIVTAATDDPLSIYYVIDLAIEKKIKDTGSGKGISPENLATHLSKRVAPLLANIVKGENLMEALKQMATLAAEQHIKGRSFKRNSILKPLDIILDNLEREPKEEMRDLVRSASERDIFDHMDRIADARYKPGRGKQEQIRKYVDYFFDGILIKAHRGDVNRLQQRAKLIRSAYLTYFRNALPERVKEQVDTEQAEEISQTDE